MDENETKKPTRRRRRAPRAAKPAVGDTLVANTTPEVPPVPQAEAPRGDVDTEATDVEQTTAETDESAAPKRRRRGHRGGRRHRRRREAAESAALATPDGEAAQLPAAIDSPPETLEPGSATSTESVSEIDRKPQPAPEPATTSTLAAESAPVTESEPRQEAVRPSRRGSRRRRKSAPAQVADAAPDVTQTSLVSDAGRAVVRSPALVEAPLVTEPATTGAPGEATASSDAAAPPARSRRPRRRRKASGSAPADEPLAAVEPAEAAVEAGADSPVAKAEPPAATEADDKTPRKRSRGRRRAAGPESEETDATSEKRPTRSRRRTRPASGVLPDLPGRKEILVTADAGELRVALVEDGRLAEIYIERPGKRSFAGNMYMGKVDNVLPGIDAAFVDVGLGRNGFLAVDDIDDPEDGSKRPNKISQMLKPKQSVLVQVSKDPMGSKGARLTGQLSLAGRYLVYVPRGSGVGVSRRLPDEERDRLREICKSLKAKDAGLIVRTVAEGKDDEELRRDLKYLSALWTRVKAKADKATAPAMVYEEDDVALQVARDLFNDSFAAVLVDDAKRYEKLVSYLKKTAPELADRVKFYDDAEPLFRAHGIEEQIASALERRVLLPSGGNLVIDHTEALTVIDVNSGRFTSGKGLEDTITHTNLEAAREVVRQLRLRDIGGIIIIDFIDMEHPKNRESVLAKLQAELDTDRTKTYVVEISPLGLVEMTRQNITDGARGILTQACPHCEGKARVLSHETMAMTVERRLRRHLGETAAGAMLVEVNAGVAERLQQTGRVKGLERETKRRFFFEGSRSLPVDTYRILAEGTLAAVEAHRIPLAEDQEVVVELDYGLTYSPADAVASVDGYQVVVLNGRRYLGEKRKVRVTTVTRAGAVAVLSS